MIQTDHTHGVHFVLCEDVIVSTGNLGKLGGVTPLKHVAALHRAVAVPIVGAQPYTRI